MVNFTTFEDKLIKKYWEENPGKLFMEVAVGKVKNRKRRIDAILIPDKEKSVATVPILKRKLQQKLFI